MCIRDSYSDVDDKNQGNKQTQNPPSAFWRMLKTLSVYLCTFTQKLHPLPQIINFLRQRCSTLLKVSLGDGVVQAAHRRSWCFCVCGVWLALELVPIGFQMRGFFGLITLTPKLVRMRVRVRTRVHVCLLYTSPSPRDLSTSRMPSSA